MALKESDILNLPDAPDFISKPHPLTSNQLLQLAEKMLPYWNKIRYSKPQPEFIGEAFSLADEEEDSSRQ
jgi:hypothetical protein